MNAIESIAINLISSLIFSGLSTSITLQFRQPNTATTHHIDNQIFPTQGNASWQMPVYFFITSLFLFSSISMPAIIIAIFSNQQILLSDARGIGAFLPSIPIEKGYLQSWILIASALAYYPLHIAAKWLFSFVQPWALRINSHGDSNELAIRIPAFCILCLPISAFTIYCFTEKTFPQSIGISIAAIAFIFLLTCSKTK